MDTLLQISTVLCLLIVIGLLLMEKVKIIKSEKAEYKTRIRKDLPDIMGKPANVTIISEGNRLAKNFIKKPLRSIGKPKSTYNPENENTEETAEEDKNLAEFNDSDNEPYPQNNRSSNGVTLDEMVQVGHLLQQDNLDPVQEEKAIEIMKRLQGTEMFSQLQESMKTNSQKIASILDNTEKREKTDDDFDIEDFV